MGVSMEHQTRALGSAPSHVLDWCTKMPCWGAMENCGETEPLTSDPHPMFLLTLPLQASAPVPGIAQGTDTPLHLAALRGHEAASKELLAAAMSATPPKKAPSPGTPSSDVATLISPNRAGLVRFDVFLYLV